MILLCFWISKSIADRKKEGKNEKSERKGSNGKDQFIILSWSDKINESSIFNGGNSGMWTV